MIDEFWLEMVLKSLIEIDQSNSSGRNCGRIIKLIKRLADYNATLHRLNSKISPNQQTGVNWFTPNMAANVIIGGTKVNIVLSTCILEIDRYLIPEENKFEAVDSFINILEELIKSDVELKYNLEVDEFHDSLLTFMENDVMITLIEIYRGVLARKSRLCTLLDCLDTACVAKHKIQFVTFDVPRVENKYHDDDYFRLDDLSNFSKIIEAIVLRFLKTKEVN